MKNKNQLIKFELWRVQNSACSTQKRESNYVVIVNLWLKNRENFILQKWALRTISNSHYRAHTDPLFVKYNVLNVYDMYKLETGVFM